ncbi:MAG: hypothetical protein FWC53_01080 [Firmicutes bacterium]|nr:hypothetical protein [Bacillota bacterium]
MEIIEKFVIGKFNNDKLCEDTIAVTEDFIAVIDGVTSQSDFIFEGKIGGKLIAEIKKSCCVQMATLKFFPH